VPTNKEHKVTISVVNYDEPGLACSCGWEWSLAVNDTIKDALIAEDQHLFDTLTEEEYQKWQS
jgi:hypothetical protein